MDNKTINLKYKSFLSLISALCQHIILGLIFSLMSSQIYLFSVLNNSNKSVTAKNLYFTSSISIAEAIFEIIGGMIYLKFGIYPNLIIGNLIIICSSIFLYLTRNVYSVYLIFFLYGIGQGISVKITRVNFVKYYYNRKGLIQGLLNAFCYLMQTLLNYIIEKMIINPEAIEVNIETNLYPLEIANKYYICVKYQIIATIILSIIVIVSNRTYPEEIPMKSDIKKKKIELTTINSEKNNVNEESISTDLEMSLNDKIDKEKEEIEEEKNSEEKEEKKEEKEEKIEELKRKYNQMEEKALENSTKKHVRFYQIRKAFSTLRFWRFFCINFTRMPLITLMLTTYRNIGASDEFSPYVTTSLQQKVQIMTPAITGIATIIFGYIGDLVAFKYLLLFTNLSSVIMGLSYYYILKNSTLVYIWLFYIILPNSAMIATTSSHTMKIFGIKHYMEISGFLGISKTISAFLISLYSYYIESRYKDNLNLGYKVMFISGGLFSFVSLILGLFEKEDPVNY